MHHSRDCPNKLLGYLHITDTPSAGEAWRELLCAWFSQASSHLPASAAHHGRAVPRSRVRLSQSGTKPLACASQQGSQTELFQQSMAWCCLAAGKGAALRDEPSRTPAVAMCRSHQECSVDGHLQKRSSQHSHAVPALFTSSHSPWPLLLARQGAALLPRGSPQHPQAPCLQGILQQC